MRKEKEKIKIEIPEKGIKILWKYLDLHKFVSLVTKKSLFFTRLDSLNDPMEGIKTKFLREHADLNKSINFDCSKIENWQSQNYVSCWFTSDRESMAMWNLYSNADSVVIKVSFDLLKKEINNSFQKFVETENNLTIRGKSVMYHKLNPFDSSLPLQKFEFSALKKDVAYAYENEYRFLINVSSRIDNKEFYEIPLDIDLLKLEVITHPKMEQWKFENIKELVRLAKIDVKVEKSVTVLR